MKIKVKFDEQQLKSAVEREAKNAVLKKGVRITCQKCGAEFFANVEKGPCPRCGAPHELAFKL